MPRPKGHRYQYKYLGRTSKFTEEVVRKLDECAAVQASVSETCFYAGISRDTYYRWMEENRDLSDRLDDLRQKPFLKARQTIISRLDDVNVAFRFLEKMKPEEFPDILKIQLSGQINDGRTHTPQEDLDTIAKFHQELKDNITRRIINKAKQEEKI